MMAKQVMNKKKKFAEEPNFTEKKIYRPDDVKEKGLAFIGHEISEDGNALNQFLHYDMIRNSQANSFLLCNHQFRNFAGCLQDEGIRSRKMPAQNFIGGI